MSEETLETEVNQGMTHSFETYEEDLLDRLTTSQPTYPAGYWANSPVGEFIHAASAGSKIPASFFAEALRNLVGGILGNTLTIDGIAGGIPRTFTVLIGPASGGKNSALSRALSLFTETPEAEATADAYHSLIWPPQTNPGGDVGICDAGASSLPGLGEVIQPMPVKGKTVNPAQSRVLMLYTEISGFLKSFSYAGGEGFASAVRDLFDDERLLIPAKEGRAPRTLYDAKLTILGSTTPELWRTSLGKEVGSGLMGRLSIFPEENIKRVAKLNMPDLTEVRKKLYRMIRATAQKPQKLTLTTEADEMLTLWWEWVLRNVENSDRLNIQALRYALFIAWVNGHQAITGPDIFRGIRFAMYQLEVKKDWAPFSGSNDLAQMEDAVKRKLKKPRREGELRKEMKELTNRLGASCYTRAIDNLVRSGAVSVETVKPERGPAAKVYRLVD